MKNIFNIVLVLALILYSIPAFASLNTYSTLFARLSLQYATISNDVGITGGTNTIEAWIYPTEDPLLLFNETFVFQGDAGNHVAYYLEAESNPDGYTCHRNKEGVGDARATYSTTTALNIWIHVACVYDGTNLTLWLTSTTTHGQYAQIGQTGNGTSGGSDLFRIGNSDTTRYAAAQIDEVRVWNTARTSAQLDANFKTELTGSETGLQAYYQLNNTWNDTTANAFNLTAVNTPTFNATVPFAGSAPAIIPKEEFIIIFE